MKTLALSTALLTWFFVTIITVNAQMQNENVIINGYVIFPDFKFVLEKQYECYGVPVGEYRYIKCEFCNKWFVEQPFGKNGKEESILYSDVDCKSTQSDSHFHNNMELESISICPCEIIKTKISISKNTTYDN